MLDVRILSNQIVRLKNKQSKLKRPTENESTYNMLEMRKNCHFDKTHLVQS